MILDAEIVYNGVDSEKDNMGLTNWTGFPIRRLSYKCIKEFI